jgi:nucleoside phosphorylase
LSIVSRTKKYQTEVPQGLESTTYYHIGLIPLACCKTTRFLIKCHQYSMDVSIDWLWQEVCMTQVDFAIITIREDEFRAALQHFSTKVQRGTSGRTYGVAQIKTQAGQDCSIAVVRCAEQGMNTAQQVANDIIRDLDPQMLLVVGIAGGVPSDDFTLGDVILSNRIDNFSVGKRDEVGKETFAITGGIDPAVSDITASLLLFEEQLANWSDSIKLTRPMVELSQFDTDTFKQKITNSTDTAISKWYKNLQRYTTKHFRSSRAPLFTTGRIASSNSVVRNVDLLVQWLQDARNILAVEMEAAGVYQATQGISQRYPVMAIRGISDIIGLERDDEWTKYACQTAAAFAYAFVTAGIVPPRVTLTTSSPASVSSPVAPTSAQPPQAQGNTLADEREQSTQNQTKAIRWEEIQRTLRFRLAELFPREESSRPIVRDVDSTLETVVVWHGSARDYWSEILRQVRIRHLELKLIDTALIEYSQDEVLEKAKADFQMLTLG